MSHYNHHTKMGEVGKQRELGSLLKAPGPGLRYKVSPIHIIQSFKDRDGRYCRTDMTLTWIEIQSITNTYHPILQR